MDKEIVQNFDINATNKKQVRLDAKIYSQDIESAVFHLSFSDNGTELNLDDSYVVTILSVFRDSGRKLLVDAPIVDGEALFTFDNRLITNWDVVDSYVYLKKGIQTVDVNSFSFKVDVSKIDSVISDIKVYYIEDLEDLKAEYIKKMESINKDHQDFLDAYIDGLPNTEDLKGKAGTIDIIGIEVLEENEEPKVINSGTESSAKLTFQLPIGHQGIHGELNDLHAQTESNTSNIELKANLADMTSLQSAMTSLQNKVEAFGITPENLVTIKSLLDAIANNATDSEVAELINSVNVLTNNISLMSNGDYSPKANQTDLESLQSAVDTQSATISTKAEQADLDNLQTTVTSQGVAISTKAEQADLDNLQTTVTSQGVAISTKAEQADLDNLQTTVTSQGVAISTKAEQADLDNLQTTVTSQGVAISTKAEQADLDNLQTTVTSQGVAISTKAEQADLLITNQNVAATQTTANQAKTDAKTAITKATEAQANSLPLTGNAVSASKLATPRKLRVSLQDSAFQNFDGTADVTNIGVSGVLPVANGGTATNDGVINTIAYANSADGTDGFTTVYPNLNLLTNSRLQIGKIDPFYPINNTVLTINSSVKGLNCSCSGGAIGYTQGVGAIVGQASAGNQYTISVKVINTGTAGIDKFLLQFGFYDSSGTVIDFPNKIFSIPADGKVYSLSFTYTAPANTTRMRAYFIDVATSENVAHTFTVYEMKDEQGSIATPYMPSASEVRTADYPKYVGFSNIIKPNKTYSDYKWLPMGLVSIDSATGLLKPAVIGIDYAQAHPVGSVISNSSSSSSGYTTGTWQNIGSTVIGSTTVYYWKRTA